MITENTERRLKSTRNRNARPMTWLLP